MSIAKGNSIYHSQGTIKASLSHSFNSLNLLDISGHTDNVSISRCYASYKGLLISIMLTFYRLRASKRVNGKGVSKTKLNHVARGSRPGRTDTTPYASRSQGQAPQCLNRGEVRGLLLSLYNIPSSLTSSLFFTGNGGRGRFIFGG